METKFGLRIRDSKPGDTGLREYSDPMDVGAVNSLSLVKVEWSSSPRRWSTFSTRLQCNQEHWQAIVWQRQSKQSVKRTMENPKGKSKGTKGAIQGSKGSGKGKHRQGVSQVLKT